MENRTFTYKNKYSVYPDCYFIVRRYADTNNLAIIIQSIHEGVITRVTTNPTCSLSDEYIAVKNYSENEGMVEFLISMNIITELPVFTIPSGFVEIPVYRLTEEGMIYLNLL